MAAGPVRPQSRPVKVGDQFIVTGYGGVDIHGERIEPVTVGVPVAAIYTDLRAGAADPYWCAHRRLYEGEPGQEFSNRPIAPLVLVDEATFTGDAAPDPRSRSVRTPTSRSPTPPWT